MQGCRQAGYIDDMFGRPWVLLHGNTLWGILYIELQIQKPYLGMLLVIVQAPTLHSRT